MKQRLKLTEQEKEDIKKEILALEKDSSGEVVPFIADSSDVYPEVPWFTATLLGVLGVLVKYLTFFFHLDYTISPDLSLVMILTFFIAGYALPILIPKLKVLLANTNIIQERVMDKAYETFLMEEVFKTKERIGILFYISALEHKVVVLADSGINKEVDQETWVKVSQLIVSGIKSGEPAEGIIEGIRECKKILLNHGFNRKPDDTDELGNEVRTS